MSLVDEDVALPQRFRCLVVFGGGSQNHLHQRTICIGCCGLVRFGTQSQKAGCDERSQGSPDRQPGGSAKESGCHWTVATRDAFRSHEFFPCL